MIISAVQWTLLMSTLKEYFHIQTFLLVSPIELVMLKGFLNMNYLLMVISYMLFIIVCTIMYIVIVYICTHIVCMYTLGLSLLCSKIYLLFFLELPKIAPPIIPFVSMVISQCRSDYI